MPPKMGGGSMNGGMGGGMNSSLNRKMMMSNQSPTYPRMDSPTTQQMAPKTVKKFDGFWNSNLQFIPRLHRLSQKARSHLRSLKLKLVT